MKYLSKVNGKTYTEVEFNEMLLREYKDAWNNNLNDIVVEFKEGEKTLQDYVEYMKKYDDCLSDEFKVIEE